MRRSVWRPLTSKSVVIARRLLEFLHHAPEPRLITRLFLECFRRKHSPLRFALITRKGRQGAVIVIGRTPHGSLITYAPLSPVTALRGVLASVEALGSYAAVATARFQGPFSHPFDQSMKSSTTGWLPSIAHIHKSGLFPRLLNPFRSLNTRSGEIHRKQEQ
jgi:hypothetical protein